MRVTFLRDLPVRDVALNSKGNQLEESLKEEDCCEKIVEDLQGI